MTPQHNYTRHSLFILMRSAWTQILQGIGPNNDIFDHLVLIFQNNYFDHAGDKTYS